MENTARRLEVLARYDILDTPPEPEFDDIAQIAKRVCNTPVALITLVAADRQWFKARVGFEACETPIGQSVCVHALGVEHLLVIPDLRCDPRTRDNLLVTNQPLIRFYAGAVLRSPEGVAIGSLCVIDDQPRPAGLSDDQAQTLLALGRQTMNLMALRRALTERETALAAERSARRAASEAEDRMRQAQKAARIGSFEVDLATQVVKTSAASCQIFGLPESETYTGAQLEALIRRQDRRIASAGEGWIDAAASLDVEYCIERANDGAARWISRKADFRFDASGTPVTMVGVFQDITERKTVERRAAALIALGDKLRDADSVAQATSVAAECLGATLGGSRAAFVAVDLAGAVLTIQNDWTAPGVSSMAGHHSLDLLAQTIGQLKGGTPVAIANAPAAFWLGADTALYARLDAAAQIALPMLTRGELVGFVLVQNASPRTWSAAEIEFAQAVADRTFMAIAKLQAEDHRRLLNEELSHRLKNTFSMVQAIATQTLRHVEDKVAVNAFQDRVIALSRAHDVLLQQSWSASYIHPLVEGVLGLQGDLRRFDVKGPAMTLGPKATLSLALILHELLTNASKHGALSNEEGRVCLEWRVEATGAEPMFVLLWTERGGPLTVAPSRRGFGTRLLSVGLAAAGKARLSYETAGVVAEFTAPVSALAET